MHARCFLPFLEHAQVKSATKTTGVLGRRFTLHRLKDGGTDNTGEAAVPWGLEGQWDLPGDVGQRYRSPRGSKTAGTGLKAKCRMVRVRWEFGARHGSPE